MLDPMEGASHVRESEDSVLSGLGYQTQAGYGCVHTGAPCISKEGPGKSPSGVRRVCSDGGSLAGTLDAKGVNTLGVVQSWGWSRAPWG